MLCMILDSYAPRTERVKLRGPIGRDVPDTPERDLYKDRDTNNNNNNNVVVGGGGNGISSDRDAQRAYNDRYKYPPSDNGYNTPVGSGNDGTSYATSPHHNNNHGHGNGNGHGVHGNQRASGNTFVSGGHSLAISVNQEWAPHPSLASPAGSGLHDHRSHMFRVANVKGGGATQLNNELHDSGLLTTANASIAMPVISTSPSIGDAASNTHMSSVEISSGASIAADPIRRSATYTMTATTIHPYAVPDTVTSPPPTT
jgi:hypothetical protein